MPSTHTGKLNTLFLSKDEASESEASKAQPLEAARIDIRIRASGYFLIFPQSIHLG